MTRSTCLLVSDFSTYIFCIQIFRFFFLNKPTKNIDKNFTMSRSMRNKNIIFSYQNKISALTTRLMKDRTDNDGFNLKLK